MAERAPRGDRVEDRDPHLGRGSGRARFPSGRVAGRLGPWRPRRRSCTGSRPTRGAGTSPPARTTISSGPSPSTTRSSCGTSRPTTSIASRGSSSGTRWNCRACRSPATSPLRRLRPSPCSRERRTSPPRDLDLPQLSRLLHLSAGSCGRRSGHTRHGSSAPPDPRAAVSRSRSTSRCPTVWEFRRGCTGTTRSITPSCRSGHSRGATPPPWS